MRITSKGQVTIPQGIREQAGFLPNTEVEFIWDGVGVHLVKQDSPRKTTRGGRAVRLLQDANADFGGMTTDEILSLLRGPE
ncbi:MAG: AbrB/MazE/SpoVT family DNA-binding domain-containing protein [Candidatus Limnocylindrales bacterium]